MPYIANTAEDQRAMLEAIGVGSLDELFSPIPAELRLNRPLAIGPALTELELTGRMSALAARNRSAADRICFLGGGSYDHFIPAVVDTIGSRGEFYTSYTPYQPEASQGNLQVFFEYQTLICALTGMDVSNASLYDGASAAAEAVLMAVHATGRRQGRDGRQRASGISAGACDLCGRSRSGIGHGCRAGGHARRSGAESGGRRSNGLRPGAESEFLRLLGAGRTGRSDCPRCRRAVCRGGRSDQPGPAEAAGRLRRRHRGSRGTIAGQPDGLRRSVPGDSGLPREIRAAHARPHRRRDGRSAGQTLLGADAANPRTAHPPRKGHEQHLHQPGLVRPAGHGLSGRAGSAGAARGGRIVSAKGTLCRAAARPAPQVAAGLRSSVLQGICRPRREATSTARFRKGSMPATSSGCRWGAGIPICPMPCWLPLPKSEPKPRSTAWPSWRLDWPARADSVAAAGSSSL